MFNTSFGIAVCYFIIQSKDKHENAKVKCGPADGNRILMNIAC
jgi:hypothetical protein